MERIYPVGNLEEAYQLKREHPDFLLCGEREAGSRRDATWQSPLEIMKSNVQGRTMIHTTSAGTQGLENATGADVLLAGALVNAKATAEYIRRLNPQHVSLVCMGLACRRPTDEDTLCAQYLRALLLGEEFDKEKAVEIMRKGDGQRFFIPEDQSFALGRISICAPSLTASLCSAGALYAGWSQIHRKGHGAVSLFLHRTGKQGVRMSGKGWRYETPLKNSIPKPFLFSWPLTLLPVPLY